MIKCKMIHEYPDKYREIYLQASTGFTIREWINLVENKSLTLIKQLPELNITIFKARYKVSDDWNIYYNDNQYFLKKKSGKIEESMKQLLRSIGFYNGNEWISKELDFGKLIYSEDINKFKGDMLEVLSEIFFNAFKTDEAIGLKEYEPINLEDDFGIDATGVNVNNHKCVVQVKYRKNPDSLIEYSDIAKTYTSSLLQLNLSDIYYHDNTIFLFTTAKGVTGAFEKVMKQKVRVINRSIISTKIDNNKTFWKFAFKEISESL